VLDLGVDDRSRPWWRGDDPGRRLAGTRAIVTGAGTAPDGDPVGIGEAIAVLFAVQGARVAIADISRERAEATLRLVEQVGGDATVTVGDVTDADDNARCVQEAVEAFGGLDTVVNNAALSVGGGSPVDVDLDTWNHVMAVNLHGAFLTARHAIPHLRAAGAGSIVNISSIAAVRGTGGGAYAASKAAMNGLTRDWAHVHGRESIRVNCILPGHVYAPMVASVSEAARGMRRRANLLPIEGTAWDVAWPAVFLASDEARWITGVELVVDAGTTSSTPNAVTLLDARSPI
jgi:NAD(P)-dependent dehydrogenase (short-subunit alcohol dehydrogenase family)